MQLIVAYFPLVIVIVRSSVVVVAVGGATMGLALIYPTIQTIRNANIIGATLLIVDCCVVDCLKLAEAAIVPSINALLNLKHGA